MSQLEWTSSLGVQMGLVAAWLAIVFLVGEGLYRYTNTGSEILRKVVHIGSGNVVLLAWWLHIPAWVGIAAAVVAAVVALLSYRLPILPGINSVGRKSLGTFFYAVSFGVLVAGFFPQHHPEYAALGMLIMAWGDGMAALIGQKWGRHRYQLWDMQKSWEGSLTMFAISYLASSSILLNVQGNSWQIWVVSLAVAVFATVLEAFSKFGIDNLTVPLGSAALAFFLGQLG
ncbi:MAG: diacylglycerol/polyprenol kinase family protein [Geitlerinemataceae cyanobacterium]